MRLNRTVLSAAILAAVCVLPAIGQVKPTPPPKEFKPETRDSRKSLPALNLPEYVITGSDVISFSGYSKDDLELSDEETFSRRAGRGIRESWYGDPRPVKDLIQPSEIYGNKYYALAKFSYGTFNTPMVDLYYNRMFAKGDVNGHVMYNASDGHVPNADYTRFGFDVNGGSWFPGDADPFIARSRVQGNLAYRMHDYGLYANTVQDGTPPIGLRRTKYEVDFGGDLIARDNRILDYSIGLFGNNTLVTEDLNVNLPDTAHDYEHGEFIFGLNAAAETHVGDFPIHGHLTASFSDLSDSRDSEGNPSFFELTGMSEYWFDDEVLLRFGLELYALGNSDGTSHASVHPLLHAEYHFNKSAHAYAEFMPEVKRNSFRNIIGINPYTTIAPNAPAVNHMETPVAFQLGGVYDDKKMLSVKGYVDYRQSHDYPTFLLLNEPYDQQWGLTYEGTTTVFSVGAETEIRPTDEDLALLGILIRDSENDHLGTAVPYLPNYEFSFLYNHRFPFALSLQGEMKILGDRLADNGDELGTVLFIGAQADYWIVEHVGVFMRLSNIVDQEYQLWQGYDEVPFFFSAGVKARF